MCADVGEALQRQQGQRDHHHRNDGDVIERDGQPHALCRKVKIGIDAQPDSRREQRDFAMCSVCLYLAQADDEFVPCGAEFLEFRSLLLSLVGWTRV